MSQHMPKAGSPGVRLAKRTFWKHGAAYPASGLDKARMDHIRKQIRIVFTVPRGAATAL